MKLRAQKVRFFSRNVRQMYLNAFSPAERMPFPVMVAMSKLWHTDFLEFYDGDTLCGFVYLAHNRKLVFIMFLAVDEALRSKGYGSAILHEIKSRYSDKKIIVSIGKAILGTVICFVPNIVYTLASGQFHGYRPFSILIANEVLSSGIPVSIVGMALSVVVWGILEIVTTMLAIYGMLYEKMESEFAEIVTMKFEIFPFNSFHRYFSADVMALYKGKWLFCMHKERTTWEHPSGWIEEDETLLEAAKRELQEETGAVAFDMEPLCDYFIDGELGPFCVTILKLRFKRNSSFMTVPEISQRKR